MTDDMRTRVAKRLAQIHGPENVYEDYLHLADEILADWAKAREKWVKENE